MDAHELWKRQVGTGGSGSQSLSNGGVRSKAPSGCVEVWRPGRSSTSALEAEYLSRGLGAFGLKLVRSYIFNGGGGSS